AAAGEKRPFPKRILFSGLFDSGKQGKEWPGDFTIVPQKGFFWHAAGSVPRKDLGVPWIRLHLRGERILGDQTRLFFRYHLTGADSMRVGFANRTTKVYHDASLKGLKQGEWAETTVNFSVGTPPRSGDRLEQIEFVLPRGAELLIDDVLLY